MIIERPYGTATSVRFPLVAFSTTSFHNSLTTTLFAAGDFKIALDDADFTNTATLPSICPGGFDVVLSLTAAEMSAKKVTLRVVDSATKVWEDQYLAIETYGTTSAMHAFNRNQVTVSASLTAAQTGVTIATVTQVTNTVQASLTAAQTGVTIAAVTDIVNGVKLTTTAILSNLGASATAQINAEVDTALADASVTANAMNKIHSATDAATAVFGATVTSSSFNTDTVGRRLTFLDMNVSSITSGGGGGTDWTDGERAQIRHALGITGSTTAGAGGVIHSISSLLTTRLDVTVSSRSVFDPSLTAVTVGGFNASATVQLQSGAAAALAAASVTAVAMNKIHTPTEAASAILGATATTSSFNADTVGYRISLIDGTINGVYNSIKPIFAAWVGNVNPGNTTTVVVLGTFTDTPSSVDDFYNGNLIHIQSNVTSQARTYRIIDYNGTSKEATLDRAFTGSGMVHGNGYIMRDGHEDIATYKTGYALTTAERNSIADAYLDRTNGIETSWTPRMAQRVMFSALAGKLSGAATTSIAIRDVGDTKDRIAATVDANGNRTAVTLDGA